MLIAVNQVRRTCKKRYHVTCGHTPVRKVVVSLERLPAAIRLKIIASGSRSNEKLRLSRCHFPRSCIGVMPDLIRGLPENIEKTG